MKATGETVERKPRANGLSRELIVSAAIRHLRDNPDHQLSMARASAAVGATPMALYRHFESSADLADAVVGKIFEGFDLEIPTHGDWREQAGGWLRAVYSRLIETPQCAALLTTSDGVALAWVRASARLRRIFAGCGLTGTKLSEATLWTTMTVVALAERTLAVPLGAQVAGGLKAIARLEPDEREELESLAADVPAIFARSVDFLVERTLASVEAMID